MRGWGGGSQVLAIPKGGSTNFCPFKGGRGDGGGGGSVYMTTS